MEQQRFKQIMQMLKKNEGDSFLFFAAAMELKKHGKFDYAIQLLEKLLSLDKNYIAAYVPLGNLYLHTGQPEKAEEVFNEGRNIAIEHNDLTVLNDLEEALSILK